MTATLPQPGERNYISKLNFYSWAKNEVIVFVFHKEIAVGAPVSAYFQWTVSAGGTEKQNVHYNGHIWSLAENSDGTYHIKFIQDFYYFEGTIKSDGTLTNVQLKNDSQGQKSDPMNCQLVYGPA